VVYVLIGKVKIENTVVPSDVEPLVQEYRDVFPVELPENLPLLRDIQHQIDLVPGKVVKSVPGPVPVFCLERNVPVSVHSGVPFRFCTVHIYLIIYMKKIKY
jgi:hypothetical protein